jgi:glycosyltransferase involved in cell wall biosynthesis
VTVHIVEPGGRGGVYHHAVSLAEALRQAGVPVVLHTAADAEQLPARVDRRPCLWRFPRVRPKPVRRALLVVGWLARGVPSCLAGTAPGDLVHVEGKFKPVLLVPLVVGARLRRANVIFSPHTTYSRDGRRWPERVVRWLARRADFVLAFSDHDLGQIEGWGARALRVALLPPPVAVHPDLVAWWRSRWGSDDGRPVVLFAGQIRADKRLDLLVRAAACTGKPVVVAVVGEDEGALPAARALGDELGVRVVVDEGYQSLDRFAAAVAAADLVACPYRVASMSAVLVLARSLGRRTVVTDVGGLPEAGTVVAGGEDPVALAAAIDRALRAPAPPRREPSLDDIRPYVEGLGLNTVAGAHPS